MRFTSILTLTSWLLLAALTGCGGGGDGGTDSAVSVSAADADEAVSALRAQVAGDVAVQVRAVAAQRDVNGIAAFEVTVSNVGSRVARNVVIDDSITEGVELLTLQCQATGGAVCPSMDSLPFTLRRLPAGASLTFAFSVKVPTEFSGPVVNTTQVNAEGDPDTGNNSASASVTGPQDERNGSYTVFATDGRSYALTVDFDALRYSMTGNGLNASGSLTVDADKRTYTVAGNARFRTAQDLVVGGFDFGAGVLPFVAARSFVTSLAELPGTFNLFGRNISTTDALDSRISAMTLSSSAMQVCADNIIYNLTACPATSISTFVLSLNGSDFTGIDSVHNDTIQFRVAKSGVARIYLRVGNASDGSGRRFRLGLIESSGLTGGTYSGASTKGAWGNSALTNATYDSVGVLADGSSQADAAPLVALGNTQPAGIKFGNRASDGAGFFVIQNGPLAVLVGARSGVAAGYMEIGVP